MPFVPLYAPQKKWLRFKSFHIYWEIRCYATNSEADFSKNVSSLSQVPGMYNIFQLLPQATFKAMDPSRPDLLIFTNLHEYWEISWDVQVCYRLADPKCQCLSSALAVCKLFLEITKASPALRQGWNPRLDLNDKNNALELIIFVPF